MKSASCQQMNQSHVGLCVWKNRCWAGKWKLDLWLHIAYRATLRRRGYDVVLEMHELLLNELHICRIFEVFTFHFFTLREGMTLSGLTVYKSTGQWRSTEWYVNESSESLKVFARDHESHNCHLRNMDTYSVCFTKTNSKYFDVWPCLIFVLLFLKINCENKSLDVCNVIFTYWNKDNKKNVLF